MKNGFIKVAAVTPRIRVADTEYNARVTSEAIRKAAEAGAKVIVTPELGLTGYTCGDLFSQPVLLDGAERALAQILEDCKGLDIVYAVGVPVRHGGKLYNCAALCQGDVLMALVTKTYLPNYAEFYEGRHFTPSPTLFGELVYAGSQVELGSRILLHCTDYKDLKFTIAAEICEDLWAPCPPSTQHALQGADIILNLSASDETVGKEDYRRELVKSQSARLHCAYVYADAGMGESSTDMVFAGHNIIAENGVVLAESRLFGDGIAITEIDLERLRFDRLRSNTYQSQDGVKYLNLYLDMLPTETTLTRPVSRTPFIPEDARDRESRCETILNIQAQGLARRLEHAHAKKALVGISGGLDSCLALLVSVRAMRILGRPASDVIAVTMPCFGTTKRTRGNAEILTLSLAAELREVNITALVNQHFADIGHDPENHNVAFENAQARARTYVLMDIANDVGGLVVGTGDLSELALGWATYNGDHMSMYGVNGSVPKTLIRHIVRYVADRSSGQLREVLLDILDTPVSPELLPAKDGEISQKTEDLVGPYELHDFILYYALRWGFRPSKILRLMEYAFRDSYDRETLIKWLRNFYRRFFAQQYKRSCIPDGPKVGSVALSPRGDLRMPSDASAALWLAEIDAL